MSVPLRFRNLDLSPAAPVADWPEEAVAAAFERGYLSDWGKLCAEARAHPFGPLAENIIEVASFAEHPIASLIADKLRQDRSKTGAREGAAAEVRTLVASANLSRQQIAKALGTSASRLSTWESGKVEPGASVLIRLRQLAGDNPLN
ncbi:MAG: helix-turn-helix domain-containing protein [Bifidobacteriaceae bacterium]|jgi:DNA-binding transcriptional regulator YiaG|nr:helix-turn-helix domain-containing protein [Bifidobacteriaceae bacterium]